MGNHLEAYVLANIELDVSWQVVESILKIEGVKTAQVVTGQFDAVILVHFSELEDLAKIIEQIHHVKGMLRTQTLLTVPPPVRAGDIVPGIVEEEKTGFDNYPDR
jgi:hypothetical protein